MKAPVRPAVSCCTAKSSLSAETRCPVEATLTLIGGKYKPLILWNLTRGTLRFSQLRKEVPQATPKMLTQQLRELERDGLVQRKVFPVVPPRVEYSLSKLGRSIQPVLESIYTWGSGYLRGKGLEPNCSMRPLDQIQHCKVTPHDATFLPDGKTGQEHFTDPDETSTL